MPGWKRPWLMYVQLNQWTTLQHATAHLQSRLFGCHFNFKIILCNSCHPRGSRRKEKTRIQVNWVLIVHFSKSSPAPFSQNIWNIQGIVMMLMNGHKLSQDFLLSILPPLEKFFRLWVRGMHFNWKRGQSWSRQSSSLISGKSGTSRTKGSSVNQETSWLSLPAKLHFIGTEGDGFWYLYKVLIKISTLQFIKVATYCELHNVHKHEQEHGLGLPRSYIEWFANVRWPFFRWF